MRLLGPNARDDGADAARSASAAFLRGFVTFFRRKDIVAILAFFLLYRFAEAQLVKMVAPFLLDPRIEGGLGLSTSEVGIVYGTVGAIALLLGGLGHLPERPQALMLSSKVENAQKSSFR